jgi:hypothetical protein
MSRFVAGILVLSLLLSVCAIAAEGPATAKPKPAAKKKAPTMAEQLQALQNQINQQQSQMKQQQDQINSLQQQLQQSNSQLQMQSQQLQSSVQSANQSAAAAQQAANNLNSSVADLKTETGNLEKSMAATQKAVKDLESPLAVHYKGITFSPGGFATADMFWRSRNDDGTGATNGQEGISYSAIPFGGTTNAKMDLFRMGAKESRTTFRVDTEVKGSKVIMFYDMDWYAQANTANEGQTYSMNPRIRDFFAEVDMKTGWQFSFGTGWTLMTPNRSGCCSITTIYAGNGFDFNINNGFSYARAPFMRVVKNLGTKAWIGFEAANPYTVATVQGYANYTTGTGAYTGTGSTGNNLVTGTINQSSLTYPWTYGNYAPFGAPVGLSTAIAGSATAPAGNVAGLPLTSATGIPFGSANVAPDLEVKLAFEPGFGHYEIKAIGRWFQDRPVCNLTAGCAAVNGTVYGQGKNNTTTGFGYGANFVVPVVKSKVDFLGNILVGSGIGRYSPAGDPDVTLKPNGELATVPVKMGFIGIEAYPKSNIDVYAYFGADYTGKVAYPITSGVGGFAANGWLGYGVPNAVQTYCGTELTGSPAVVTAYNPAISSSTSVQTFPSITAGNPLPCNTANKLIYEAQFGFWHRFWKGPQGTLQWGIGYAWLQRSVWNGVYPIATATNTPYGANGVQTKTPIGAESAAEIQFKYILP